MIELIARPQFEAFAKVMEDAGFDVRAPWECSLDDLEQHHFDTYQKAIAAALAAEHDGAREALELARPYVYAATAFPAQAADAQRLTNIIDTLLRTSEQEVVK